ncbi:phosphatidate cytidylyltransferase [Steroidobacter denitrificans]|uniref:Phosphatidate cytidylyltransferase n=1 Tax=Steroidobacter denitrificans TaxID=465721 RepID=A0A127FAB3_STEDE|nr:phosphatidate cytidylyltransferase [Steroidobacter denitrificans]AMN47356.1 phosphatidate cytidylyltransferase [Steroidobacter denitrificans]
MLRQRVITALILGPAAVLAILFLPQMILMAVLAAAVLAGAWEWSVFPGFTRHSARWAYVGCIAVCLAAAWWWLDRGGALHGLLYVTLAWWLLALIWVVVAPRRVNRLSAGVAGLFVLVPAWLALVRLHAMAPALMLFLLLLAVSADIGAYFVGRRYGRHKLAPQVSPGKTWEGVCGGLLASAGMAAIGVAWFSADPGLTNPAGFIGLCVAVVAASIIGDLTESMFKRHAGLKDSGTLLPGHGGVLDRIDSITAAAPMFLLGLERLGLLLK